MIRFQNQQFEKMVLMRLRWRIANASTLIRAYFRSKLLCTKSNNNGESHNNMVKVPSTRTSVSTYEEQYKQLQNLDLMAAAKMLLDDPIQKKKFGFDFHLVQFFFACMPSLAVYLVAQYARHEMRKMDAILEKKKKAEEEKIKEVELIAAAEKAAEKDQFVEVKDRLEKLEEVVKEIAVASKKQSDPIINGKKLLQSGDDIQSSSETTSSVEKEQVTETKSDELKPM